MILKTLENFSFNTELSNVDATHILFDREQNQLWVTIDNIGIDILDVNTNKVIKLRDNNSQLLVRSLIMLLKILKIIFGCSSATDGLLKFDPN